MKEKLIQLGLMAGGTILAGIGGTLLFRVNELAKKFDVSVKELKDITTDKIKDSIVESAVRKAAEDQVSDCIVRVHNDVMGAARNKISDETRKAVMNAKEDIEKEVSERISKEAALIDMEDLRKSARDKAEEKILSKFNGNLDDLLGKFNENLSNVQRIYGGIADAISKTNKATKEIKFSLD